jgi:exodeoxyribonuclease VII large subunit
VAELLDTSGLYRQSDGGGSGPERPLDVYTVSRLNREARDLLEGSFPRLWIEGELSNFSRPASGHWYFSLKDEAAQVRCAMFRGRNRAVAFVPRDGLHVLVKADVSLFEARGDFQLIVDYLEETGDGALRRAFELLKQRLHAEGLFDEARKKPIPALPKRIGVVTSPTGAALRDILSVLQRRFPAIPVLVYPVPVQGADAALRIAEAIDLASQRRDCDVLLLARGGGSLEDLWAFNDEAVARAIHRCRIPVVTGIGHEIDFTIADFVADLRAPTPSGAAERVSPDQSALLQRLERIRGRLQNLTLRQLAAARERLGWLEKRLQHPGRRLTTIAQRLDEMEQRLARAQQVLLRHKSAQFAQLQAHLQKHNPMGQIASLRARHEQLALRLRGAVRGSLEARRARLGNLARALEAVSPLSTLARGYAIVTHPPGSTILRRARDVAPGSEIQAQLAEGKLVCDVREILDD